MSQKSPERREAFKQIGAIGGLVIAEFVLPPSVQAQTVEEKKPKITDPKAHIEGLLAQWDQLVGQSLWYKTIMPQLWELWDQYKPGPANTEIYEPVDDFFEKKLFRGEVKLATSGPNYDAVRRPFDQIDTFIIHHTATRDNVSARNISAIELLRIYGNDYAENQKTYDGSQEDANRDFAGFDITNQDIWSNHIMPQSAERGGQRVMVEELTFAPYHFLVNPVTGEVSRTLKDEHVGYHVAGSNARSIAAAVVGNFSDRNRELSEKAVDSLVDIYKMYKGRTMFDPERVRGHRELPGKLTECPGDSYYNLDKGWKRPLIQAIRAL